MSHPTRLPCANTFVRHLNTIPHHPLFHSEDTVVSLSAYAALISPLLSLDNPRESSSKNLARSTTLTRVYNRKKEPSQGVACWLTPGSIPVLAFTALTD